jgi:hypothetical protein
MARRTPYGVVFTVKEMCMNLIPVNTQSRPFPVFVLCAFLGSLGLAACTEQGTSVKSPVDQTTDVTDAVMTTTDVDINNVIAGYNALSVSDKTRAQGKIKEIVIVTTGMKCREVDEGQYVLEIQAGATVDAISSAMSHWITVDPGF